MKKRTVICLLLCVTLLAACATRDLFVVENEVPKSLLRLEPAIPRPNVNTGNNTRDYKNGVLYLYSLEDRIALYENRILCIEAILNKTECTLD